MAVVETSIGAAAGAGIGAATITLTGSFLGIQYDAFTLALLGGFGALLHLPPIPSHARKMLSVLTAAFLGGLMSPLALAGASQYAPEIVNSAGPMAVRLACAFVIGLLAQPAIPLGFDYLRKLGKDKGRS